MAQVFFVGFRSVCIIERGERERERERENESYAVGSVYYLCTMYTTHRTETERHVSLSRRRWLDFFKFSIFLKF